MIKYSLNNLIKFGQLFHLESVNWIKFLQILDFHKATISNQNQQFHNMHLKIWSHKNSLMNSKIEKIKSLKFLKILETYIKWERILIKEREDMAILMILWFKQNLQWMNRISKANLIWIIQLMQMPQQRHVFSTEARVEWVFNKVYHSINQALNLN